MLLFNAMPDSAGYNLADIVGYIPTFLSENDPRSAREQLNAAYGHGGGWDPFEGFTLDRATLRLQYPGDPPTLPMTMTKLREETIIVYEHAWVAVIQPDGSFEVCRMD